MRVNEIIPGPEGHPNQSMTDRFKALTYLEIAFLAVALTDYLGPKCKDPVALNLLAELDALADGQ